MNPAPRSLLFVSSRANSGAGGETYLLRVLQHLDRTRFRPVVVLPQEGNLIVDLTSLEVDWHIVNGEYGWLKQPAPWYSLLADTRHRVDQMLRLIEQEAVELVHTNSNHRIEGALAANLAGIHHLYLGHIEYQHDMPIFTRFPLTPASYARLMGEISSHIVTVSKTVADNLAPYTPAEKIQVIHNGLDLDSLDNAKNGASIREALGLAPETVLVSAVGRINPDKGFDYYVEAAYKVLHQEPQTHFLLIGGEEVSEHADTLRERVKELAIDAQFHFLGFREDVASLLHQSDIFVLSSRREGHPFILLEAMACNCAAVACRCAGVDETVVQGVTGYTVELGDLDGLATGVMQLVRDPDRRRRMGIAARERIEDHFQASDMVDRLMAAYDHALSKPPPRAGSPAVDLFVNAATEIGQMGQELDNVQVRLRTLEARVEPLLSNPIAKAIRGLRGLRSRRH